ncbi:hypothetical protein EDB92DRAFT_2103666 [Lactarius akahatsu]|uniref:Uncharacterized protein n=1 Tax=Lactarius akahatsu TaxID=416441 RepID=A0AAD4LF24_9AGAM|nr:hypothetical protein EDB92DRAFT_2103666 [Lactarius akahatsu]
MILYGILTRSGGHSTARTLSTGSAGNSSIRVARKSTASVAARLTSKGKGSPAFVPAAQQDLITITLEILARDPVANAVASQRDAFREACMQLAQAASTQARAQALSHTHGRTRVLSEFRLETLARTQAQAADSIEVVKRALEPVAQSLRSQTNDTPTPYSDLPLSLILGQQVVPATAPTVPPENGPVLSHVGSAQNLSPPPIEAVPPLHYSVSPSAPATGSWAIRVWRMHLCDMFKSQGRGVRASVEIGAEAEHGEKGDTKVAFGIRPRAPCTYRDSSARSCYWTLAQGTMLRKGRVQKMRRAEDRAVALRIDTHPRIWMRRGGNGATDNISLLNQCIPPSQMPEKDCRVETNILRQTGSTLKPWLSLRRLKESGLRTRGKDETQPCGERNSGSSQGRPNMERTWEESNEKALAQDPEDRPSAHNSITILVAWRTRTLFQDYSLKVVRTQNIPHVYVSRDFMQLQYKWKLTRFAKHKERVWYPLMYRSRKKGARRAGSYGASKSARGGVEGYERDRSACFLSLTDTTWLQRILVSFKLAKLRRFDLLVASLKNAVLHARAKRNASVEACAETVTVIDLPVTNIPDKENRSSKKYLHWLQCMSILFPFPSCEGQTSASLGPLVPFSLASRSTDGAFMWAVWDLEGLRTCGEVVTGPVCCIKGGEIVRIVAVPHAWFAYVLGF